METKLYEVKGTYRSGIATNAFRKVISAHSESFAREKTFSLMGSKHKLARNMISIKSVAESREEK